MFHNAEDKVPWIDFRCVHFCLTCLRAPFSPPAAQPYPNSVSKPNVSGLRGAQHWA